MKKMFAVWSAVAVLGVVEHALSQVTTTAVPFLLIAPNSRASALGESGVALADDAWAIYWNPAGYAFQRGSELSLTHANWLPAFNFPDLWIAHIVYKQPVEELDGVMAVSATYLNLGEFDRTLDSPQSLGKFKAYEYALAVGYSTKVSENLGLGVNVRLIHSDLAPFGAAQEQGRGVATGFSFDVGMLYKPRNAFIPFTDVELGSRLSLGFNLSNVGPKLAYIDKAQADPLPMNLRLGFAYQFLESEFNNMTFNLDVSRLLVKKDTAGGSDEFYKAFFSTWTGSSFSEQMRQFVTGMGLEYWYGSPRLIAMRAGFFYEDPRTGNRKFMTFGAGIRFDIYGFDFSYINAFEEQHPLGNTLRFSLSINWGGDNP
ncbi:MAG: type IX secretion system outer membrane channel protein PorV [Ignavibacteriales bacterium]|nr:type IX secretion system outer membrane channel protein PorV [Ignavibacteriales bacterium]